MKKVLIVSSPYFGYHESMGNAFSSLGYTVHIETYDEPIHPFKGLLKLRHKLAIDKESLRAQNRYDYSKYIISVFDKFKPDIVFIFNGTILEDSTLDYFRKSAKVAIWMYDSVQRSGAMSRCVSHIEHCDAVFCFENTDVEFYKNKGFEADFLPVACDTSVYHPIENVVKDVDICFVGIIYTNPKRMKYLEYLAEAMNDRKIVIYGLYKPWYKDPIAYLTRKYRNIFMNENIAPSEVNKLFARSRVALNIHSEQTKFGANPRVYETCASGAFQVCDYNPFITSLFRNNEVSLYETPKQMVEKIEEALTTDTSQRARQAYEIVTSNHTFLSRAKTILDKLGEKY